MRKVFAGILLALSLPAMADLAADLKTMSPVDALKKAKTECGANCDEAELVKVMLKNGVTAQVAAQAAKASEISPVSVAQALASTGIPPQVAAQIVVAANPDAQANQQLAAQIYQAAATTPQQPTALGGLGGQAGDGGSTTRRVNTPIVTTPVTPGAVIVPVVPEPNPNQSGSPT